MNTNKKLYELANIKVTEDIKTKALSYSEAQYETSEELYKRREPWSTRQAIINRIFTGKVAEACAYIAYSAHSHCSEPDWDIYQKQDKKGHDPDLEYDRRLKVHLKCWAFDTNRYQSWLFRGTDPVIRKHTDYDVFGGTIYSKKKGRVLVLPLIKISNIVPLLKPLDPSCEAMSKSGTKALYMRDMIGNITGSFQAIGLWK